MKPTYEFKNLTKPQQQCLVLIESLGIYELRALARVFGDNSPTVLKRNDHIQIVMQKIISGEDLKPIPVRQGRPYKELSNIEGILAELSQITGKDYTLKGIKHSGHQPKLVSFKQIEDKVYKQKLFPIEARGILCEKNDKELFFIEQDTGKSILVKKEAFMKLKPFDYVTGTAVVMNKDKEYILDEVSTVNYQNYKEYKEVSNVYLESNPSFNLKFKGKDILMGMRYCLNVAKFTDDLETTKSLIQTLHKNNIVAIGIVPNVMFSDLEEINSLGFDNLVQFKYEDAAFDVSDAIFSMVDHVERLQSMGLSLALFVKDPTTIANSIDFVYKNTTKARMGHTEAAVDVIKSLVSLAKDGGKGKSTTFFTTYDQADLFDQMYVSSIYKVCKKIDL